MVASAVTCNDNLSYFVAWTKDQDMALTRIRLLL